MGECAATKVRPRYSTEALRKAVVVRSQEKEWRRRNNQLFQREVVEYAVNELNHERRFSLQPAIERIRWRSHVDSQGEDVKINDRYKAIWARLLLQRYPEMEQYLEIRPAVFDLIKPSW